ncbi:EAL domain-containing protein [Ferribacterium limneticum]|uniref:EAL domain-containing protein n=1 Tax=Ferribacterium limneticum TaxID=76259 RepID=UPI001CF9DF3E|nr:EAL domain-containing protein [Ferribacterium limneticum]UCV20276.1 EAL domain-containing protein [Ferribacterium limneticum]
MSLPESLLGISPRYFRLGLALFVGIFVSALSWLFYLAESVSPEVHFAYTQKLRDLGEFNARVDGQILANRLEQVRNYDAMTSYMSRAELLAREVGDAPGFLAAEDRAAVATVAGELSAAMTRKAGMVDQFKRDNAILRNSISFFPIATSAFLDTQLLSSLPGSLRDPVGKYAREVLAFAHTPSKEGGDRVLSARNELADLAGGTAQKHLVDNILRHGDSIGQRLGSLEALMAEISNLRSDALLEKLTGKYAAGHARAHHAVTRYRMALYAMAILLTAFLAYLFFRLDLARRSLATANRELGERYAAQLAVEKQLILHATAFRSAHDGITLTDASGNILDVNPAFSRITGWERSEVIGRNPRVLKSGRHDREFYEAMWKSINETDSWRGEIWNRNKYGEVYPELLSISAVRDSAGKLTNYVAVFSDIGRLKAQESQLTQMAYYDPLTELPNRTLLADRLVQGIAQTRRTTTLMAICYLDLDGFKPVNDTWGHGAGDMVLIEIANRMRQIMRGGDTVARLGGDEFVLLLLGFSSEAECQEAIRRLQAQIAKPLTVLPEAISISASIGVTLFPNDDEDPDTLLRHADQAMYRAKQAGKNCFQIFDAEQDRHTRSRRDHVNRIRQALDDHEFVLYYQPKVNMRLGKVTGAEALIRWNHPERGILAPSEFLPLINDDVMVKLIGDWVIEMALGQMEVWHAAGLDLTVSVNVASKQLQAPEFVEKLKAALFLHPGVAHLLEMEILETAALEDVAKTSRVIDECRALGVRFSLDDFGTGYSSLTYLKRLPAEIIKIDQSFVREILSDYNNLVIVQGVISLASAFQREIIAEGVETVEHGRLLLQLNCDHAQGYGIAKPMPAEKIVDWVRQWQPDPMWREISDLYWDAADYPMLIAEIQLRNWVSQIVYATNEGQPAPCSHLDNTSKCEFGQWYFGETRRRYESHPVFAEIERPHQRIHEIASQIDNCWRDGRIEASRTLIPDLLAARDETLALLLQLQRLVGVRRS